MIGPAIVIFAVEKGVLTANYKMAVIVALALLLASATAGAMQHGDLVSGPVFIQEPPNQVDFSNTTGTEVICQSRGTPMPQITWVKGDGTVVKDVPGLRQVC